MKVSNLGRLAIGLFVLLTVTAVYPALFTSAGAKEADKTRKILYYRNPMNPSITSDVPAKDSMGMDFIPVYEESGTAGDGSQNQATLKLSPREIALAGVVSEEITFRDLFKEIRTVGKIAYDPQLYKAEEEFIQALKTSQALQESREGQLKERTASLAEAARLKLRLMGLSDQQIDGLKDADGPDRSLIISDEKNPYVWVYADVYEYELSWVKEDQPVKVVSLSYPGEEFQGRIVAIDPVLNPDTRAERVRIKIDNSRLKLKPQMYVDIYIKGYLKDDKEMQRKVLAVPENAVLDTGMRKLAYLDLGNGIYSGKEVEVGPQAEAYVGGQKLNFYPVVSGLKAGDKVVTRANFLIDSQSQLTATVTSSAYGGALGAKDEVQE
jgi:Cu(I)/Ag(I) efflux system membrane fusion protein